jgi:hypothetical protein
VANTKHGPGLARADKQQVLATYVERGRHLNADGDFRTSRAIAAELNHI